MKGGREEEKSGKMKVVENERGRVKKAKEKEGWKRRVGGGEKEDWRMKVMGRKKEEEKGK